MSGKRLLDWSIRSTLNVEGIRDYIERDNPAAAQNVLAEIRKAAHSLRDFPMLGHAGRRWRRSGTRELVLSKYPYTIIYRLTLKKVIIASVIHQSRRNPK